MAAKASARPPVAATERQRRKLETVASSTRDDGAAKLDRLIYERVRLGIMSALAVREEMTFNELKQLFEISDGNLGGHARKLEDAGYVTSEKAGNGTSPKTMVTLTKQGRDALDAYTKALRDLLGGL